MPLSEETVGGYLSSNCFSHEEGGTLDGVNVIQEKWEDNTLTPLYDAEEQVCGIVYNEAAYYFVKNLQGDVIRIADDSGNTVAKYSYDAWMHF